MVDFQKSYTVELSADYELVIPEELREAMHLKAGMRLRLLRYGERIEVIPLSPMAAMRGSLSGMDATIERDESDRL